MKIWYDLVVMEIKFNIGECVWLCSLKRIWGICTKLEQAQDGLYKSSEEDK